MCLFLQNAAFDVLILIVYFYGQVLASAERETVNLPMSLHCDGFQ